MARKKLERYQQVGQFKNYFDLLSAPKTNWNHSVFEIQRPLTLELGCGYGEYVVFLAQKYPERNFVGVDVKSERMFIGLNQAKEKGLDNAAFFRAPVQFLPDFFAPGEVDELWITFPDPFLKEKKHRRRLTSAYFLSVYRKFLKKDGIINFKTDCAPLFEYTEEVLHDEGDQVEILFKSYHLHEDVQAHEEWLTKTRYETHYHEQGVPIKFVQFKLK